MHFEIQATETPLEKKHVFKTSLCTDLNEKQLLKEKNMMSLTNILGDPVEKAFY